MLLADAGLAPEVAANLDLGEPGRRGRGRARRQGADGRW